MIIAFALPQKRLNRMLRYFFQACSQDPVSHIPVSGASRLLHLTFIICHLFLIGVHYCLQASWQNLAGCVQRFVSEDSTMLRKAIGCFPCWKTIHGRRHRELVRNLQWPVFRLLNSTVKTRYNDPRYSDILQVNDISSFLLVFGSRLTISSL